ncbi:MAG: FHA domain-containing protein [Beutenbergiaceae bacterium]
MTDYSYAPGEWTALAHAGRAALLSPSVSADVVDALWESLSGEGALESWLELLAVNGLAALPDFALVAPIDDGLHVVVRGEVSAQIADYEVSATDMRTWREHIAPGVTGLVLRVADGQARFPLVGGLVLASALQVGQVDPAILAQAEAVEPAVAPLETVSDVPEVVAEELVEPEVAESEASEVAIDTEATPVSAVSGWSSTTPSASSAAGSPESETTGGGVDVVEVADFLSDTLTDEPDAAELNGVSESGSGGAHVLSDSAWRDLSSAPVALELKLSTGQRVALNQPVLIGRAPESPQFSSGRIPRLVTVPSPQQDISRTHVEIKPDADQAMVTDLRSTNGTVISAPGSSPRRLHPGEAFAVPVGTLIDLGDGVSVLLTPTASEGS